MKWKRTTSFAVAVAAAISMTLGVQRVTGAEDMHLQVLSCNSDGTYTCGGECTFEDKRQCC